MQAPGFRMNEREPNPNPYIAFIRSLKAKKDKVDAESILKAVAAQMKKIMEQRFMFVGTLEEAEFNTVFAGRNWNHGQSIELVLRGPSCRFLPLPYITSVMCHEMAHIEQMNHGPKFQALMRDIKADVSRMQARGNFGDGFWSDGHRLQDSIKMGGEGLQSSDFPEYVCGVTAGDARKARAPRRRASAADGLVKGKASHLSGRQTEYVRKAGRKNNVDMGEASGRLDGAREITKEDRESRKSDIDTDTARLISQGMAKTKAKTTATERWDTRNPWFKTGNTRGKVAKSKSAAEMRATAAEARLRNLSSGHAGPSSSIKLETLAGSPEDLKPDELDELEDEDDYDLDEVVKEEEDVDDPHATAAERKREMEDEMDEEEMEGLRGGWEDFVQTDSKGKIRKRERTVSPKLEARDKKRQVIGSQGRSTSDSIGFGKEMVEKEKSRGMGMTGSTLGGTARKLGGRPADSTSAPRKTSDSQVKRSTADTGGGSQSLSARPNGQQSSRDWTCALCTYVNLADHGRCEICQARPDGTVPSDVQEIP